MAGRRTTGCGVPGSMTQERSWKVSLGLFDSQLRGHFLASRQNYSTYYRSCVYVLSAFLTLRRNHHWVVVCSLSGRSDRIFYACCWLSMYALQNMPLGAFVAILNHGYTWEKRVKAGRTVMKVCIHHTYCTLFHTMTLCDA